MATEKLRNPSERSNTSEINLKSKTQMEFFWACELSGSKRSFEWTVPVDDLDEDDHDYIEHTLFLRSACLGAGAVEKEENIVEMESVGENGEMFKGIIANLQKGLLSTGILNLTVDGKSGVKFTLVEGNGPVSICGNHLLDYPVDHDLDTSQTELSRLDDTEDDEEDEDIEEEEEEDSVEQKVKAKATKRKAPVKANKQKQKAKMQVDEEEDEDEDEEEEEDDDEEEEEEESDSDEVNSKSKKGKKEPAKKATKGNAKPAPVKDNKKGKKAKK